MTCHLRLPVLCLALLSWGHVNSFSIRHRAERSTDLADALAILQRQRRRVGEDFLQPPDRLLEDEPLTLQDVSDWFNGATGSKAPYENEDMESDWLPDLGGYKDFEPSNVGYDLTPGVYPTAPIKASPHEIEAIFEADGNGGSSRVKTRRPTLSKKTKEEMVNVKGDRNVLHKSSWSNPIVKPSSHKRGGPNEVLNSLTKEEVKVLMKAVGKLQEQLGNAKDIDVDDEGLYEDDNLDDDDSATDEAIVVSEPVSQEELKSVFEETDGPINKETRILLEKGPDDKEPTLVEEQVVTEKLPDISEDEEEEEVEKELTKALTNELANELEEERESEEEAAEEAVADVAAAAVAAANLENQSGEDVEDENVLDEEEDEDVPLDLEAQRLATKYWLLNGDKFFTQPDKGLKRTAKRASGLFENNKDPSSLQRPSSTLGHLGKGNNQAQINLSWLSPQLQAFVLKIISLQDEVDRLRLEARLEDLENDALTDALNEATLAQMEGTVSDVEWSSLQQAISLEAALQDIKHSKPSPLSSDNGGRTDDEDDDDDDVDDDDSDDNVRENVPKRGEPWRRKRFPSVMPKDDDVTYEEPESDFSLTPYGKSDNDIKNRAIEKLLEQSYFLKGRPGAEEEDSADIASLFMSDPERCPAVQRYSSNCALADLYSVPVDFEARALCNLHEMCYACGKSLQVEQGQCDLVYRTAAASLCKGKDECEAEAEVFLRAMKLKTRYITHAQPTCRSRCTAKFLGMF